MSHYETLGVDRDASAEDIKRAYRKKASQAHPDKNGGDTTLMQAVNQANDVLSDPERRARYDESGDDAEPDSIEKKAMRQLVNFFQLVLEMDGNMIRLVREHMGYGQKAAEEETANLKKKVAKLTRRRDKIKVKSGENLVHMMIDGQLAQANDRIAALGESLEVLARAKVMLEQYISEEQEPGVRPRGDDHLFQMMEAMAQQMQRGGPGRGRSPFDTWKF
ncbi:Chaperone protein DnaJ [compost metagenome]